jgi:hypothetical protein
MTNAKFNFNEIVKIQTSDIRKKYLNEKRGVIKGKSCNEQGDWSYGVTLFEFQEVYCFDEIELQATGEFAPKDLYDEADTVTVVVDKNGKGEIKK